MSLSIEKKRELLECLFCDLEDDFGNNEEVLYTSTVVAELDCFEEDESYLYEVDDYIDTLGVDVGIDIDVVKGMHLIKKLGITIESILEKV